MSVQIPADAWPVVLMAAVVVLLIFRKPLFFLLKLLLRSLVGLGFLFLWAGSGVAAGLALGVNVFNALTLGLLGLPGLGLLLMLKWLG